LAGVRGIEPRSKVLETFVLTAVLYPYLRASTPHGESSSRLLSVFFFAVRAGGIDIRPSLRSAERY
jgi:hypothetical protein